MARSAPDPLRSIDETALADRLARHVDRLAGLIGPRHLGRPSSMEAAEGYVRHQLESLGDAVEAQAYEAQGRPVANLIVERTGATRPGEIVVLGAHYDTVEDSPGADDNASAVAMLIEVARLLQDVPTSRTVRFVAFACEEPPNSHTDTMGSQVYALRCRERHERIIGMLCLEMVGFYSDEPGSQAVPPSIPRALHWLFPSRGDFLAAVGNLPSWRLSLAFRRGFKGTSRFPLFSIVLPEVVREIRLSDNAPFWAQGFPALMLTDTSFLRNPHYHQPSDLPDTLDYDRMSRVAIGVAGGLLGLARKVRGERRGRMISRLRDPG